MDDDALEKRLAAIEARLDALEGRPPERATMKDDRRCPSCGCTKLLRTAHIADIQSTEPLGLSSYERRGRAVTRGKFEVHACTQCGLAEWHALDLRPSILENSKVKLIEPEDDPEPEGPYR